MKKRSSHFHRSQKGLAAFYDKLFKAISSSNTKFLKECLEQSISLNILNENSDDGALHLAAEKGDSAIGTILLKQPNIDINIKNNFDETPLHIACNFDKRDFVLLLLQHHANPNVKNNLGRTPLHLAAYHNLKTILRHLVDNGADLNIVDSFGNTPLYYSLIETKNLSNSKYLLIKGAKVHYETCKGIDLFLDVVQNCCSERDIEMIQLLLDHGANINQIDKTTGRNCLHIVALTNFHQLATYLLKRGAKLNVSDHGQRTPIEIAKDHKHKEVLKIFFEFSLDGECNKAAFFRRIKSYIAACKRYLLSTVTSQCKFVIFSAKRNIEELLLNAVINSNGHIIKRSLRRGVNPNRLLDGENAGLHIAAETGDTYVGQLFLEANNIDVDIVNSSGETPLVVATRLGHREFVQLLIKYNADVNALTSTERTPLHIAVYYDQKAIIYDLIQAGANIDVIDAFGNTPLSIAVIEQNDTEITKFLLRKGANIQLETVKPTGLFLELILNARGREKIKLVEILLHYGGDIHQKNKLSGQNCLHVVALTDNSFMARVLLKEGADLNVVDVTGRSPIMLAKKHGNRRVLNTFQKWLAQNQRNRAMHSTSPEQF